MVKVGKNIDNYTVAYNCQKMNIGYFVIGIGVVHCTFGFIVFSETWIQIFRLGFFNSIGEDPMRGAVAWFYLYGIPVISYGYMIHWIFKILGYYPNFIQWHLFGFFISGVVLMPASGLWLFLIPMFLIWKNKSVIKPTKVL